MRVVKEIAKRFRVEFGTENEEDPVCATGITSVRERGVSVEWEYYGSYDGYVSAQKVADQLATKHHRVRIIDIEGEN